MKTGKKVLLGVSGAALLVAGSIAGTLAYLTSTEEVVNTFTIGKVDIDLTETELDENYQPVTEAGTDADGNPITVTKRTDEGNEYRIVPGAEYIKDPTLTIKKNSEEAYVRLMVNITNWNEMSKYTEVANLFPDLDDTHWERKTTKKNDDGSLLLEYRYVTDDAKDKDTVTGKAEDYNLEPLFETIVIPQTITTESMEKLEGFKVTVQGHAIQSTGFDTADAAWKAFDAQENAAEATE